jgi:hypothetical protein
MKIKYVKDESGVFSNYLRVVDWLWLKDYVDFELEIDWKYGGKNLLEDILSFKFENTNIEPSLTTSSWVEQDAKKISNELKVGLNKRRQSIPSYSEFEMNGHPGYFYTTPKAYFHKDFKLIRKEFNSVIGKYTDFDVKFIEENLKFNSHNRTLGVHLRCPKHYCHDRHNGVQLTSNDDFFVQNADFVIAAFERNSFDQIYIACDSFSFIDKILTKIPSKKVFYHAYDRGDDELDWFEKNRAMDDEVKNMFVDFINLKYCSHAILSTSNVAFGLLCHNTEMTFEMFPILRNLHGM